MPSFREQLAAFAQGGVTRVEQCHNEECTKLFLVLPFLRLLGYDPHDPDQVTAEHAADFADRYQNRVDFLLRTNGGTAAIALECKQCGTELSDCRGQLKRYFSALPGSKVGGLTNGLEYEFFTDSVDANIMDDEPFLSFSLKSFASGTTRLDEIELLENLTRERFNADQISLQARRRLLKEDLVRQFADELKSPSDELCRLLLQRANRTSVRSSQIEAVYRSMVKGAIEETLARKIWNHFHTQHQLSVEVQAEDGAYPEVETTDRELYIFGYCRRRLAFLVNDDSLFREIEKIGYKDFSTKFGVYYDRIRQGRLFDFYEGDEHDYFVFPDELGEFEVADDLEKIDQPLLTIFMTKVRELRGF
jgi:hypothetical protein